MSVHTDKGENALFPRVCLRVLEASNFSLAQERENWVKTQHHKTHTMATKISCFLLRRTEMAGRSTQLQRKGGGRRKSLLFADITMMRYGQLLLDRLSVTGR